MSRVRVGPRVSFELDDVRYVFARASGPGGQNVNKVETAVQLRFDVSAEPGIPEDVKHRLKRLAGRRMTDEGVLVLDARRFRSQSRNREDAFERFVTLLQDASVPPVARVATKPGAAVQRRRQAAKKARAATKQGRKPVQAEE